MCLTANSITEWLGSIFQTVCVAGLVVVLISFSQISLASRSVAAAYC
jgi:hypothetical protein